MADDAPTTADVARLRLEASDVLVIKLARVHSKEEMDRMTAQIRLILNDAGHEGVPVLFMSPGMDIVVLEIAQDKLRDIIREECGAAKNAR